MHKLAVLLFLAVVVGFASGVGVALAQDTVEDGPELVREIFVPFDDLHVLLEDQPRRVLLSRAEYDELLERAKRSSESRAPRDAVIVSADYEGRVQDGRALITGTLLVDVLEEGLHTVGIYLGRVGLRGATLDEKGAPIGKADDGRLMLFVEGKGQHRLVLDMVAPVETTAARQMLTLHLPTPGATRLRLTVAGDVEVKSGAEVVSRHFDESAEATRFELLPKRAKITLVMTLNSRLKRADRVVIARSVLVDEVTMAYERLHLTSSMAILHKAVDRFQFAVPQGFEVTQVNTPQLARWAMVVEDGRRTLDIRLREPTTKTVVLNVSAVRTGPQLDAWVLPRIVPLDVVGQPTVVGLLIEDSLKVTAVEPENLIPINTSVVTQALPASVFQAEPGAPRVRPVLAYYAPQAEFSIAARFERPVRELLVTTNLLLVLKERIQQVKGGFALLPEGEKLFDFDIRVPADWHVIGVTAADGNPLPFERYGDPDETHRVHVRLPRGVEVDQPFHAYFQAESTPSEWMGDWESMPVEFPVFTIVGATREEGAIAIAALDDMSVRPQTIEQLTPLDENQQGTYGLGGVGAKLAYRFDDPAYQVTLVARRIAPRLTARSYSFFTVESDVLTAHYEVEYDVEEARTRTLTLLLDPDTPTALSIRGLDGLRLKEYTSEPIDDMRRWTVLLAEGQRGTIRIAIDFQQPLAEQDGTDLILPVVVADGVAYQSGIVSVEGSAELDVQIDSDLPPADIGELVDAEYQPGNRLLGAYRFVGAAPAIKISSRRRPAYQMPPAIVERAELVTVLSTDGVSQTSARYRLRTKANFLEVQLPPNSTLWSAELDGQPTKPQREGAKLLLSLPATGEGVLRDLRMVYETPVESFTFLADVDLAAPTLWFRTGQDTAGREVPVADLLWHLHLPSGTRVVRSDGTVVTSEIAPRELAIVTTARFLYRLSGGVNLFHKGLIPSGLARARELSKSSRQSFFTEEFDARARGKRRVDGAHSEQLADLGYIVDDSEADEAAIADKKMPGVPAVKSRRRGRADQDDTPPPSGVFGDAAQVEPQPGDKIPSRVSKGAWALSGVQSLKIDLEAADATQITFRSLGEAPRLAVTLTNRRRFDTLAWALALGVGLIGLAGTNRSARSKVLYLTTVGLLTTLVPLITASTELTRVCNLCFHAAVFLACWYPLFALAQWLGSRIRRVMPRPAAIATGVVLLFGFVNIDSAKAAPPDEASGPFVVEIAMPPTPVTVPNDAVIVPYDPESQTGIENVDQLLVPYDRFVELWNRAYPEEKIETQFPPAPYAFSGAAYSATLEGDEFLLMEGTLGIDVYADGQVTIPLRIAGGVLARADLDGRPARLGIAQALPETVDLSRQSTSQKHQDETNTDQLLVLYASGKGRHQLELAIRMRLQRRGGWQLAMGKLPAVPASRVTLRIPDAQTEVRLGGVTDRRSYLTKQPEEMIETAPGAGGAFGVQWRPKAADRLMDQSVTAESIALLNIQEAGLTAVWHFTIHFRHGQRDFFSLQIPPDYLVAKVAGDNVRGWEVRPAEQHQQLDISLLNPATDSEDFTVHIRQDGRVGEGTLTSFDAPTIRVDGAALHHGLLVVHRSPLLEVRTIAVTGMTRSDVPEKIELGSGDGERSPLGIQPYAAYRFPSMPCALRLSASTITSGMSADVQTLLRISGRTRSLEVRFNVDIRDRGRHHLAFLLPNELDVEQIVAPGVFEWSLSEAEDRKLLAIHLAAGRKGRVPIVVRGTLGDPGVVEEVSLPRLEVLDVERQQGNMVVQVDPAFDVRATDLQNCRSVLLDRTFGWLGAGQRELARLAFHYQSPDYVGVLHLTARQPAVTCNTITNVRTTDRSLEETILLNFSIQHAGIRELSFLLPARMADARISVPLLRQKTVEPEPNEPGPMVRVRLTLQDAVLGELRVLVEDDRLLTRESQAAPIPMVRTGRTVRRYVVLESAGRDEIVVEQHEGFEILSRQQKEWRDLVAILGTGLTKAYAAGGDEEPQLTFKVKDRVTVQTAGARIGLAQTNFVLDAHGAYRATHTYWIHNTTEQFLEFELPDGADLWTARVAGEAVKPAEVPKPTTPRRVRIPLIKTAAGDLDYTVSLKYGGRLPALGRLSSLSLPLIRAVNINAELSQVRLFLPDEYHWLDFGGTMRLVENEEDLAAGYVSYQTELAKRLSETMQSADSFARLRAAGNLERLSDEIRQYKNTLPSSASAGELQKAWASNVIVLRDAEEQVRANELRMKLETAPDHRSDLNVHYKRQRASRSGAAVQSLVQNFGEPAAPAVVEPEQDAEQFDRQWLIGNQLDSLSKQKGAKIDRLAIEKTTGKGKGGGRGRPPGGRGGAPAAPEVFQQKVLDALQEEIREEPVLEARLESMGRRGGLQQTVERYQQVLEKQAANRRGLDRKSSGSEILLDAGLAPAETPLGGGLAFGQAQGLASLDVEIPARGIVYRFTTPRGEMEITAWALSRSMGANLKLLGIATIVALAVWRIRRLVRSEDLVASYGGALTTTIIVVGMICAVTGILPVAGLAAAAAGIMWKVQIARGLRRALARMD